MVTNFAGVKGTDEFGSTDGTGTNARFNLVVSFAISGTNLYVADEGNCAIRVADTETKEVTTLAGKAAEAGHTDACGTADGTGTDAQFLLPYGLAISGAKLYVADNGNNAIRIVDTETKEVTTLTGVKGSPGTTDGTGTNAMFNRPAGLAISGTKLYVTDQNNNAIRVVDTGTKEVTTLAGGSYGSNDGIGTNAQFSVPEGLAISGTKLYVADMVSNAIRMVDTDTKEVTTLAGGSYGSNDGTGTNAQLSTPIGLAISCNKLYVASNGYNAASIRVVDIETTEVTTVAGGTGGTADGTGTNAQFLYVRGLQLDPAGDASTFYVADRHTIRLMKF